MDSTGDPTRLRVYRLLAEGHAMSRAASIIGVSRQTVLHHKRHLEACGAIRRIAGRSPATYERGPRAAEFETDMAAVIGERGGRFGRQRNGSQWNVRTHRGSFVWRVQKGPRVTPTWSKNWRMNRGSTCSESVFTFEGVSYRIRETRGRSAASLYIEPPEAWVPAGTDLREVERGRYAHARRAASAFARRWGYELQGRLSPAQPTEFALPVTDVGPLGVPGESPVWIDHSKGASEAELETQKAEAMEVFLDAPVRFARIEADVGLALRLLGQLGPMVVKITEVVQQLASNQAQLLERMVTPPADPAAPEVA